MAERELPPRLVSLDAYRGFVMLAMASGGLSIAETMRDETHRKAILSQFDGTSLANAWQWLWTGMAFQFDHVDWGGCTFWDLIQPSFMFMVGVALPFSLARRAESGESPRWRFAHALLRSFILVALGVFLTSAWSKQTKFLFTNVLAQIGLGYPFLYLMAGRRFLVQLLVAAAVLGGYGAWFAVYTIPLQIDTVLREEVARAKANSKVKTVEFDQYTGRAAHWNKHTNAAAAADRQFLNLFPQEPAPTTTPAAPNATEVTNQVTGKEVLKPEPQPPVPAKRRYWFTDGGYQTLNFIPSFVTMLFGLMTGQLLRSERSGRSKLWWMLAGGLVCFLIALGLDTRLWPIKLAGYDWIFCPAVKRIWTPTWTLLSTGWVLWILSAFYAVIDLAGWKRWAFPFVVVGMNSIVMYCAAQLIKPWLKDTTRIHLTTLDAVFHSHFVQNVLTDGHYARIIQSAITLLLLWLICWWLYRQKIFVRI